MKKHDYMTLKELAAETGISYYKLVYDARRNSLPVLRSGKYFFVDRSHPKIEEILADPSVYARNRLKLKPRPVLYEGKVYPSVRSLAKAVQRNVKTVVYWLLTGKAMYVDK